MEYLKIYDFAERLNNCLKLKNKNCGFRLEGIRHKGKALTTSVNIDINKVEYNNIYMKFDNPLISLFLIQDIENFIYISYEDTAIIDFAIIFKDGDQLVISFYDEDVLEYDKESLEV